MIKEFYSRWTGLQFDIFIKVRRWLFLFLQVNLGLVMMASSPLAGAHVSVSTHAGVNADVNSEVNIPVAPNCPASVMGYWLTYDDHSGQPNGVMQLKLDKQGVLSGALVKVINKPGVTKIARCTKCKGKDHNRVLDGMTLITGMRLQQERYESGRIFDPRSAYSYKGRMQLLRYPCRLKVRGYLGFSLLGKTVYWTPLTKKQAGDLMIRETG